MTKLLSVSVIVVLLVGCAASSAPVVNGEYSRISVLTETPEGAEHIANLRASSGEGPNQQKRYDNAVADLKKHASSLGANAIVLTDRGAASETIYLPSPNGVDRVMHEDIENVEGMAIVVK